MKNWRWIFLIVFIALGIFLLISWKNKEETRFSQEQERQEEHKHNKKVTKDSLALLPLVEDTNCQYLIQHPHYILCYNDTTEQANWVAYKLYPTLMFKNAERKNRFLEDPAVICGSAKSDDYKYSGYDRGHLLPSADMRFNQEANNATFYMSNISPQLPSFNRGVWRKLEEEVRKTAILFDSCYIVTGPIHYILNDLEINNGVDVPDAFYKTGLLFKKDSILSFAYIIPHENGIEDYYQYISSIDDIEEVLNVNLYPILDYLAMEKIEKLKKGINF